MSNIAKTKNTKPADINGNESAVRSRRLVNDLKRYNLRPVPGVTLNVKDDNMNIIDIIMMGDEGTAYEGGTFKLLMTIPDSYPFDPPSIKFVTRIYHPNIDPNGLVCLDLLKQSPSGSWRPCVGFSCIMASIKYLLSNPNPDDPLMPDIAEEYLYNITAFKKNAKEYINKYCTFST